MAFALTILSLIMAAGLCALALCSSSTSKLTAILGSISISAFLPLGASQLADDIVETKRPTLEVITKESLARVAARKPRWVCSKGVLQHVPPEELDDYFASLSPLIHAGATGLLFSQIEPESRRVSVKTWAHDFDQLHATAKGPRHAARQAEMAGTLHGAARGKRRLTSAGAVGGPSPRLVWG